MTIKYSPNFNGFFEIALQSDEYDSDILFDIPAGQPQNANKMWEYELDMGGLGAIDPDYSEYTDGDFVQWFAARHGLSDGRYSFSWRMAFETIPANWTGPAEYNNWMEISDIQVAPQ